jgi:hypothetical protein
MKAHPFTIRQLIVCIDNKPYQEGSRAADLDVGKIYRVDSTLWDEYGRAGVTLIGLDHLPAQGWHAFRFKR